MNKYTIRVHSVAHTEHTVSVEADSDEEAIGKVRSNDCEFVAVEYVSDVYGYVGCEFQNWAVECEIEDEEEIESEAANVES